MTTSWQFWALLSAVFAASTALLSKLGVRGIDPDAALLVRTLVVVAVVSGALAMRRVHEPLAAISGVGWMQLLLAGAATGASWACYFRALKLGEVARVAAVDKLSVAMIAIVAAAAMREPLGVAGWAGVALMTAGAVLLSVAR